MKLVKILKAVTSYKLSMIILILLSTIFIFGYCKEEKRLADIAPDYNELPAFAGQWRIEGADLTEPGVDDSIKKILFLDPEQKSAKIAGEEFALEMDSLGVRIRATDRENPLGYFLFSEIRARTWVGTWEERVVRLIR